MPKGLTKSELLPDGLAQDFGEGQERNLGTRLGAAVSRVFAPGFQKQN